MKHLITPGLILPIIVGIFLLLMEYKVIAPETKSEKKISADPISNKIENNISLIENKTNKAEYLQPPLNNSNNLLELIALSEKIYGTDAKNVEFLRIVKIALTRNEYEIAEKVAGKIYGTDLKNDSYELIIHQALKQNRFKLAESIADKIYGTERKNAALKEIITEKLNGPP